MSRARAFFACVLAAASINVAGCASFKANPTASDCAKSADVVAASQMTLTVAQAVVAAIQAGQTHPLKSLQQAQADVVVAQAAYDMVAANYLAKCSPTPAKVSALRWRGAQDARLALEKRAILAEAGIYGPAVFIGERSNGAPYVDAGR